MFHSGARAALVLACLSIGALGACHRHGRAKAPVHGTPGAAQPEPRADAREEGAPRETAAPPSAAEPAAASTGNCHASCAHYLGCKAKSDARATSVCVARCEKLGRTREQLVQFEQMPCDAAVAAIEGTGPADANGGPGCPAPMSANKTPQDDAVFTAVTSRRFCGWTYNQASGVSREKQLIFTTAGVMQHGVKSERSLSMHDAAGRPTVQWNANAAGATNYCWKVENGQLLYSSNGAGFEPFVTKVEDNGSGVTFFQTRLGEFKACN